MKADVVARLAAARQAALLAAGEAWLAARFGDLAVRRDGEALRLTGPGLVARALGGRAHGPEPQLVTLGEDLARALDEGVVR